MGQKTEALDMFATYTREIQSRTGKRIKALRTDNGGEYLSRKFSDFMEENGIEHQRTVPHTPQQNGISERFNRTLLEMGRTMLIHSGLPLHYWQDALSTAAHTLNRLPTKALNNGLTPHEAITGCAATNEHLRPFGCLVTAHIPDARRRKLDAKAREGIMIGYPTNQKGYRIMDRETKENFTSRDVKFFENIFPARGDAQGRENDNHSSEQDTDEDELPDYLSELTTGTQPQRSETAEESRPTSRASMRTNRGVPPLRYMDEQAHAATTTEPTKYQSAVTGPDAEHWKRAMDEEMRSLKENNTWEVSELPKGQRAIGGKWCYRIKTDSDGNPARYKARFVAQGLSQRYGIDYKETFSPVACMTRIRAILSIAAIRDMEVATLDVDSAYLYGELDPDTSIYVRQAPGYEIVGPGGKQMHYKMKKTLYGLKQSGRTWWKQIDAHFKEIGFTSSPSEPCVYAKDNSTIIGLYVDDIIAAATTTEHLHELERGLQKKYKMKPMGPIDYILGIKVDRDRDRRTMRLTQTAYIDQILSRFGMSECKPAPTPYETTAQLQKENADEASENFPYREAVGSLMYVMTCTRPDIAFAVGKVARQVESPSRAAITAVKRIMRYLKGTRTSGITLGGTEEKLTAFADADFAGDINDRRSTTGVICFLGSGPVSWKSRKQSSVALSTTEAEYMAICDATKEVAWLRPLLKDMGSRQQSSTHDIRRQPRMHIPTGRRRK